MCKDSPIEILDTLLVPIQLLTSIWLYSQRQVKWAPSSIGHKADQLLLGNIELAPRSAPQAVKTFKSARHELMKLQIHKRHKTGKERQG